MLTEFFEALSSGDAKRASNIAVELVKIAEICVDSKPKIKKELCKQDHIMEAMEKSFCREFKTITTIADADKIYDMTFEWKPEGEDTSNANEQRVAADSNEQRMVIVINEQRMATVQQFVMSWSRQRRWDLVIDELKQVCDAYNEVLCHEHASFLKKTEETEKDTISKRISMRGEAFLKLYEVLESEKRHEEKMHDFKQCLQNFTQIMMDHPLQQDRHYMLRIFSKSVSLTHFRKNILSILHKHEIKGTRRNEPSSKPPALH